MWFCETGLFIDVIGACLATVVGFNASFVSSRKLHVVVLGVIGDATFGEHRKI